jgi:glutathione S-transferase
MASTIAKTAAKPILGYWSVRGLGAQIRYMLAYANVDHAEELYAQTFDESAVGYERWNRDEWFSVKFTKGLAFPNLPYFLDGDVKLVQASAIQRYVCTKWCPELLGKTPADAGRAAMLEGLITDLNGALDKISFSVDGTREQLRDASKARLEPMHKFLGESPFLVGADVTYVDFILFEMLERCNDAHMWAGALFAELPRFEAYHARVAALPRMLTAEQRAAQGFFNGWRAKHGGAGAEMFKKYKENCDVDGW